MDLVVANDVSVLPADLFFGSIPRGSRKDIRLLLRFQTHDPPKTLQDINVTHALGDMLDVHCEPGSQGNWTMTVSLRPGAGESREFIDDNLVVQFPGRAMSEVTVPIRARVTGNE